MNLLYYIFFILKGTSWKTKQYSKVHIDTLPTKGFFFSQQTFSKHDTLNSCRPCAKTILNLNFAQINDEHGKANVLNSYFTNQSTIDDSANSLPDDKNEINDNSLD